MRLFRRGRQAAAGTGATGRAVRGLDADVVAHLDAFATSRVGVEAYVEPEHHASPLTVVLVAQDGEWTRRRLTSPRDASQLGQRLGIPVYDVNATGYPARMRQWTARQRTR